MLPRIAGTLIAALASATSALSAQAPLPVGELEPPAALGTTLRDVVSRRTGGYPFAGFRLFGRDSALLVFDDSTLTGEALRAGHWMFGPPVTAAEADSCPPEKVLGRKIARAFWVSWGRPAQTQYIMVAVRGTQGIERWTAETMYYPHGQLASPWVGDDKPR